MREAIVLTISEEVAEVNFNSPKVMTVSKTSSVTGNHGDRCYLSKIFHVSYLL